MPAFRPPFLLLALWSAGGYVRAAPVVPPVVSLSEASIVFPADSGVLNVRDAKYCAKGDGLADDTVAIQKALTEGLAQHRVVYLPDGTYLVSDTLKWQNAAEAGNNVKGWGPFLQLQGQSRAKTIIRLKEGAAGYGDADAPKAVIQTGSSGGHGGKKYSKGEGNEAFENHLRNFTVDVGKGNAGAIGVDYQVSNTGAMRHVSIKGQGYAGISLERRDNGPGLIKDVSVDGFQFGIRTYQEIAHFTLENIALSNQSEAGIWMRDSVVAARKITSKNSVPAIQMAGVALLALFDCDFSGGEGAAAIAVTGTEARLYVRSLKTAGYQGSVRLRGQTQKAILAEWSSDAPLGNAQGKLSLGLPIRDTPEWYDADPKNWAILPPPSGNDDTKVIQAALDSGKATVFFRFGRYFISDTLRVPGSVKRMQGTGSQINTKGRLPDDKAMLRFEGGKATDLTIFDRFECSAQEGVVAEHLDARTVVLRDIIVFGGKGCRNQTGAGPLFIEDVAAGQWRFAPGTQVWGRQWNIEGGDSPKAINDGATVWGMGMKHEAGTTIFENKNGGRLELWAGLAYTGGVDANTPAYINTDASLAVQTAGMTYTGAGGYYDLLVKDTQKGQTKELRRAGAVGRGGAATIPLYVSVSGTAPQVAAAINQTKNTDMNLKTLAAAAALATAPAIVAPQTAKQAVAQTAPKTYKAPEFFDGEEKGKPAGNPLEVGGKALWRADQIWPDDVLKRENYKPMNWAGESWLGAYEYGSQPSVKVEGGKVGIISRGAWGGGGSEPGNKRAALVFIAPQKGTYRVTGTARAFVWEGDKAAGASLSLLKSDPKTNKITRLRSIVTPDATDVAIEGTEVELDVGEELIFLNAINSMYTAAVTDLTGLKIAYSPTGAAPAPAPAPAAAMKVGQSVEIAGKSYKVVKIDGKQITLEIE